MGMVSISLPDGMKARVEARVRDGLYTDIGEYVRDLIRADLDAEGDWEITPEIAAAIDEGEASGFVRYSRESILNEARAKYRED